MVRDSSNIWRFFHLVALRFDGTVLAVRDNSTGASDVTGWRDIIAVSAGGMHTLSLKIGGTVVSTKYKVDSKHNDGLAI